jgi:hypothetical protein
VACRHALALPRDRQAIERRTVQDLVGHFSQEWHRLTADEQEIVRLVSQASGARGGAAAAVTWGAGDASSRGVLRRLAQHGLLVVEGTSCRVPSRAWAQFVAAQGDAPGAT